MALPPGPAVLGPVAPHAQIFVAGEDALAVANPVAVPPGGGVDGILPDGAFILAGRDGGLAVIMVGAGERVPNRRAPAPEHAGGDNGARARRERCITAAFIHAFVAIFVFMVILQYIDSVPVGKATAAPEVCYPWEAPPPARMHGGDYRAYAADGGWNGGGHRVLAATAEGDRNSNRHHRAHAAAAAADDKWNRDEEAERVNCFKLVVREAVGVCYGMRVEDAVTATAAAPGLCYPWEAPPQMPGDHRGAAAAEDDGNDDADYHRARAADNNKYYWWKNGDTPTRCVGQRWSGNDNRAKCFRLLVGEAMGICFGSDDPDPPGHTPT